MKYLSVYLTLSGVWLTLGKRPSVLIPFGCGETGSSSPSVFASLEQTCHAGDGLSKEDFETRKDPGEVSQVFSGKLCVCLTLLEIRTP